MTGFTRQPGEFSLDRRKRVVAVHYAFYARETGLALWDLGADTDTANIQKQILSYMEER
jgi:hypothetical protein